MVYLTEEMKAQLMKVTGISDVSEFDSLVKQAAPDIGNFDQPFVKILAHGWRKKPIAYEYQRVTIPAATAS